MLNSNTPHHSDSYYEEGLIRKNRVWLYFFTLWIDVNEWTSHHSSSELGKTRGFSMMWKKTRRGSKSRSWPWCSDVNREWRRRVAWWDCVGSGHGSWGRWRWGLTAGEAAHFTVLCARLVHEGAMEAGPHGWRWGRNRGAAYGPVPQRAGGLPTHSTWEDRRRTLGQTNQPNQELATALCLDYKVNTVSYNGDRETCRTVACEMLKPAQLIHKQWKPSNWQRLTAQLLDGGPLLWLLPGLCQILIGSLNCV